MGNLSTLVDRFTGTTLDAELWTATGTVAQNGDVTFSSAAGQTCYISSVATYTADSFVCYFPQPTGGAGGFDATRSGLLFADSTGRGVALERGPGALFALYTTALTHDGYEGGNTFSDSGLGDWVKVEKASGTWRLYTGTGTGDAQPTEWAEVADVSFANGSLLADVTLHAGIFDNNFTGADNVLVMDAFNTDRADTEGGGGEPGTFPRYFQAATVVRDADSDPLPGRPVGWRTSDVSVATVAANGIVTRHQAGSCTLTARVQSGYGFVEVSAAVPP